MLGLPKKIHWLIILVVCFSCKSNIDNIQYYKVTKTNYENTLIVSGFLESQNSINIACPRIFADLTIYYLIEEGAIVNAGDTVCILEAPEVESNYLNALKDLEIAETEYNKSLENLSLQTLLLESQVKTIEATTSITKLDSLQSKYSSESQRMIIDLEIKKAELEKEKLETKLKFLKEINQSELAKLKLKIEQSQNNVNRQKDILDKLVITSKNNGVIVRKKRWGSGEKLAEGDVVWNRMPILSIPDLSSLQAKLVLDEASFKRILPEQRIILQINSFPEFNLTGNILRKSGAGRPIKEKSPVKVFDVIASIDSVPPLVKPGLSVSGKVFIEEISDTIAIPLTCIFDSDSMKTVYLKSKEKFIKQEVTIAEFSSTHAVISSGLKENDVITTYIPPSKKIQ